MVIIIVLNLIFGVIIDTFADLRSEKQKKEEILKTTCFICGECGGPAVAGKPGPTDWRGGVQALGSEGGAAASSGHWAPGAGGPLPSLPSAGGCWQPRDLEPQFLGPVCLQD